MTPHAFVAMPFGSKPGADGGLIHFNRIYQELLLPALQDAGCEVFRADDEQRAGDIRTDMFQELLVADLVLADLTLDNPNVWYELGVRHALRARGVLLVQGPRASQPFDIYTDRKLNYRLKDGAPDPACVAADRAALAAMARATLAASSRRKLSPVYVLLDHLREPEWRSLLLAQRSEFSQGYEDWRSRMEVARQKNLAGDILVLADETPTRALWLEARRLAGNCLLKLQHFELALEQFDAALALEPDDKPSLEKRAVCLGRLGRHEQARETVRVLTEAHPADAEVWALSGRVEKSHWISRWRDAGLAPEQMREAAAAELASLEEAIAPYHRAFIADPSHHYSGINSLTLHQLLRHLGGEPDATVLDNLAGGVLWASLSAQRREPRDYWARASFAELCLLLNPLAAVQREYRGAVAAAQRDRFALESTRETLTLLRDLQFRPDETAAALQVVEREIARLAAPFQPRQVLLFSGHMVDAPGRAAPRLPAAKLPQATQALCRVLDGLGAGDGDLLLTQGAAGGDLIFAEACRERGVRVQLLLPLDEPEFIERSVLPSQDGEDWRQRYFELKAALQQAPRVMPDELGPLPKDANAFERCNLWLLHTALAWGPEKVRFVCLWDGGGGDGPGGTAHMYHEVKRRTGRVSWVDTRKL
ncbi:MAG TPA: tetratricopeptide repeat protein [Rubrivivax sp.]|nr:tetratricopeptide repeat protein [Rubrivivax sp.]